MNFRRNEIAFERAARDYYTTCTGREDWSALSPLARDGWRRALEREAEAMDRALTMAFGERA